MVTAASMVMIVSIGIIARTGSGIVRDWAPLVYILAGYYLSGSLFVAPSPRLEAWLIGWDRQFLGDPTTRFARWPRWVLSCLDIVYLFCFVLMPAGFATLAWAARADLADRYWTMIVAAEFVSFAPLAFAQSRPPWAVERAPALPDRTIHQTASRIVRSVTIGANTLPSGHTAGSLSVAFAVVGTARWSGAVFLLLALSIALACVVGRYHYIVDVAAGAVVAVAVWVAGI